MRGQTGGSEGSEKVMIQMKERNEKSLERGSEWEGEETRSKVLNERRKKKGKG